MTIAVDRKTGKVVGQVVQVETNGPSQPYTWPSVHVLTAAGYKILPASSVRLEEVA